MIKLNMVWGVQILAFLIVLIKCCYISIFSVWMQSKRSQLTIPVVFSLGFFMMMATCSLTSRINWSATPFCVCRTVQQMWMLWKRRIIQMLHTSDYSSTYYILFLKYVPGWVLQCVQIPALWRQRIRQAENIKNIGAYRHHGHLRVPKHKHTIYLRDSANKKNNKIISMFGVINEIMYEINVFITSSGYLTLFWFCVLCWWSSWWRLCIRSLPCASWSPSRRRWFPRAWSLL